MMMMMKVRGGSQTYILCGHVRWEGGGGLKPLSANKCITMQVLLAEKLLNNGWNVLK